MTAVWDMLQRTWIIYGQIIKQENILAPTKITLPTSLEQNDIPLEATKELLKIALSMGECYVKNDEVFKEEDGSLILTKKMYRRLVR